MYFDINPYYTMGFLGKLIGLLISLIAIAIGAAISALFLWFSTKIFKIKKSTYVKAFRITFILGVIGFAVNVLAMLFSYLPRIGLILTGILSTILLLFIIFLSIWLIKQDYRIDLGKTFLVWIVWIIMSAVFYSIVAVILGFLIGAAFIGLKYLTPFI